MRKATIVNPSEQEKTLEDLAGPARFQTYRDNTTSPKDLYLWNATISAEFYILLGHVEIALRNHIDRAFPQEWALPRRTPAPVYSLLRRSLQKAQRTAGELAHSKGREPTSDDVVAQLSFGSWCHLIGRSESPSEHRLQELWERYHAAIFTESSPEESNRICVGQRLERLRKLRNRIAHYENLLQVNFPDRLQDITQILGLLDPRYVRFVAVHSRINELISQDPRP